MAEVSQHQLNNATRQNPYLAEHIAYAEEPWRVGIARAHELGETATATTMSGLQLKAAREVHANPASHVAAPSSNGENMRLAHETSMTPERLDKLLKGSLYVANPYVWGREHVRYNGLDGNTRLSVFKEMELSHHSKGVSADFTDAGVSDVVTVGNLSGVNLHKGKGFSLPPWPAGEHAGEPCYAVQYMTLTSLGDRGDPSPKYKYIENRYAALQGLTDEELAAHPSTINNREDLKRAQQEGRVSDFSYTILLPKSEAEELLAAMMANPQLARDIGDNLVQHNRGQRQSLSRINDTVNNVDIGWNAWKPPYQNWNEVNGGVDRMAFRTNSDQTAAQSVIVEYNQRAL